MTLETDMTGETAAAPDIDPANTQLVSRNGQGTIIILMPRVRMTRAEALTHAAWLVALADDNDEFAAHLAAVRNT